MLSAAALSSFTVLLLFASSGRPRVSRPPYDIDELTHDTNDNARIGRPLALGFGAVASILVVGVPLAGALGIGFFAWPRVAGAIARRRKQTALDAALPDAIEMLILIINAGMTPHQAVSMLTERAPRAVRAAFVEVDRRRSRGASLADALGALPELAGPGANIVADTLAIAERYGTPIAGALEQLSMDVRERRVRQAEADARKLPVRMSFPLVVCTLPSFVLIAIVPAVLGALSSLDTGL